MNIVLGKLYRGVLLIAYFERLSDYFNRFEKTK